MELFLVMQGIINAVKDDKVDATLATKGSTLTTLQLQDKAF